MTATDPYRPLKNLETIVKRVGSLLASLALLAAPALAGDSQFLLNLDINMKLPDGSDSYSIRLHGVHLVPGQAFHGDDLGKYDYFLTVSGVEDGSGKLTIEFYEYETRKKKSEVVSEVVSEVDFSLNSPAVFEAMGDTFGVDLAFSVSEKQ